MASSVGIFETSGISILAGPNKLGNTNTSNNPSINKKPIMPMIHGHLLFFVFLDIGRTGSSFTG